MLDFLWGALLLIVWVIDFILGLMVSISRLRFLLGFGEWPADSAMEAAKRARLKILSPAAQRALDEAEQRRRDKRAASDRPGGPGGPAQ
jgi:hypothetical protein